MKTILIAVSAIALATPSLAQMTTSPAPAAGDPAMNAPTTGAPQSAMPSDPSAAATASAAPQDPKTIIAAEFPTYDKDTSGALSRTEFDTWMVALRTKSDAAPMKAAEQTSWLKGAFTTADKDKNKTVSLAELTDYLTAQG